MIVRCFSLAFLILLFSISCTKDVPLNINDYEVPSNDQNQLKEQIDQQILETIKETGRAFDWNTASSEFIFRALQISDGILVVGYNTADNSSRSSKDQILKIIKNNSQEKTAVNELLQSENSKLGSMHIKVSSIEMIELIRTHESTLYVDVLGYPFNLGLILKEGEAKLTDDSDSPALFRRDMLLDPQSNIPYPDQVAAFDGGLRTVMRRHNMEMAYEEFGVFGEGIGLAVLDNGLLPERTDFFYDNGYGERYQSGYYNPLWFLPWTNADGVVPRPSDVFGISQLFYSTYYIHGSEMIKMALTFSPNANIHAVRASTWTVIIAPSQVHGIANAIMAMADDPSIHIVSMSMGTIFQVYEIRAAIEYFHSKGKVMVVSAGSTLEIINELLGVLYPGILPETVTITALQNRENTDGEFLIGEGSHGGPENDFVVENTGSSSVSCSRAAGMIALIWSANPSMNREELMNILIESSYFYQTIGEKDPLFGWGPIDVGLAVEMALGE